ncbi:FAD binding domain-containing protein [Streptomyces malaysiensis]|uniref:FAD binding domain-containing protein n=1 Tax=Streptomyces malaysiensis subsp. samsunensis TaxID=459658 RepID=A0A9X2M4F7_STRMQ|nr:FAD binding domain-containing protein [Streptomyces samsunensis]MCQ8836300.1 FAD binding domain-containing protein [Streptomyces samsunensis]
MNTVSYAAPTTLDALVRMLAERGDDVTLVAGGMSVMPLLNRGIGRRDRLVTLNRVVGLDTIEADEDEDDLVIGATVTHARLAADERVHRHCRVLADAAGGIGDPQVRNRGTLGGALAYANPGADELTALTALTATVVLDSSQGTRRVPVAEFLLGAQRTARRPDEVVTAVRVPRAPAAGFARLGRVQGAPPTITAAAVRQGERLRVAVGGVASRPVTLTCVPHALEAEIRAAALHAPDPIVDDPFNPPDYRRAMAVVMTRRASRLALDRR